MPTKMSGMEFWRWSWITWSTSTLLKLRSMGSPVNVVAPMVDASELAWRMLGRRWEPIIRRIRGILFLSQARSTSGFYTHVARWLFHQGFKVQVAGSSKLFSHQLLVNNWTIKKSLNFSGLTLCRAALKIDLLLFSFAQTTPRFISSHCLITFPLPYIFLTNRNGDYRNCQVWLQAVKLTLEILPDCDAIDLNLGCPQVSHKKSIGSTASIRSLSRSSPKGVTLDPFFKTNGNY